MKNFEKAQVLIEQLTTENENLKKEIAQLSEYKIREFGTQVDSGHKMELVEREKSAAMKKFTERMRNEARKQRNGKKK